MNARENILNKIAAAKLSVAELPEIDKNSVIKYDNLFVQFKMVLESIGGKIIELNNLNILKEMMHSEIGDGLTIVNTVPELGEVHNHLQYLSADILVGIDTAYIRGTVAVAENGAVWLYESQMVNRLLPFICQHLILVIDKKNIVATMHQAYQQIDTGKEGFGVFIAGPSKTADIEQSLVIGAHGARSLTVYL